MTLKEFEQQYAERSGMTIEQLHDLRLFGVPCDCEESGCKGWQMQYQVEVEDAPAGTT